MAEPRVEVISHVARAHYVEARLHRERGDADQAARSYKRAILFDDDSPQLYLELGTLYVDNRDPDIGMAWLEEAVALGGGDEAKAAQGLALFALGRLDEAVALWAELPPSPARASLSLELGELRAAIDEADPGDIALLAEAAERGGLCGPALERARPQTPMAREEAAQLAMDCQDPARALDWGHPEAACLVQALEEDAPGALGLMEVCDLPKAWVFRWRLQAGLEVDAESELERAEEAAHDGDWDMVMLHADDSARGLALQGQAWCVAGVPEAALPLLNRSLEMAPADPQVMAWAEQARYQSTDCEPSLEP